ncbi:uncharacterized protein BT62DRAFT_326870 [Guyanagaster necrorhizus]|uniref:Uncharacterized protein n=1 Tax=Guyanagaster necrorhizus TaxID=856835 RepID=A0A9P8APT6_9AGAR|nr:uncharacterized protein BT62DRAFT_326870 [Guyanagaster necrorhizus MCA 3950]KAG7443344.1 hypothetical protein BT62DRAFT_326870 [Guyanagaster necrorhizus MCA 3950]
MVLLTADVRHVQGHLPSCQHNWCHLNGRSAGLPVLDPSKKSGRGADTKQLARGAKSTFQVPLTTQFHDMQLNPSKDPMGKYDRRGKKCRENQRYGNFLPFDATLLAERFVPWRGGGFPVHFRDERHPIADSIDTQPTEPAWTWYGGICGICYVTGIDFLILVVEDSHSDYCG